MINKSNNRAYNTVYIKHARVFRTCALV